MLRILSDTLQIAAMRNERRNVHRQNWSAPDYWRDTPRKERRDRHD
ncbi:MAG: hypothetical protein ABJF05_04570 [Paracoccaceae bacterium]